MTTNYHTPISDGDSNAASTVNTPLGTLDAQLTTNTSEITTARGAYGNLDARLDALVAAGGNVATLTEDSATANGATTINVDSTTGLIVGARIVYTLSDGNLEYNTIATIPDGTSITVDTGVDSGGSATIPGNTYLSMVSPSEYAAATSINYGNSVTPTLADAVQWSASGEYNVRAYGAVGDGTTDDTAAFKAAIADIVANAETSPQSGHQHAAPLIVPNGLYRITEANALGPQSGGGLFGYAIIGVGFPVIRLDFPAQAPPTTGTFAGSGLNDATFGGVSSSHTLTVQIDATGTPDTFQWKLDTTQWTTGVAITGSAQTLGDTGLTVTFGATTGHTLNDQWTLTASATNYVVYNEDRFRFARFENLYFYSVNQTERGFYMSADAGAAVPTQEYLWRNVHFRQLKDSIVLNGTPNTDRIIVDRCFFSNIARGGVGYYVRNSSQAMHHTFIQTDMTTYDNGTCLMFEAGGILNYISGSWAVGSSGADADTANYGLWVVDTTGTKIGSGNGVFGFQSGFRPEVYKGELFYVNAAQGQVFFYGSNCVTGYDYAPSNKGTIRDLGRVYFYGGRNYYDYTLITSANSYTGPYIPLIMFRDCDLNDHLENMITFTVAGDNERSTGRAIAEQCFTTSATNSVKGLPVDVALNADWGASSSTVANKMFIHRVGIDENDGLPSSTDTTAHVDMPPGATLTKVRVVHQLGTGSSLGTVRLYNQADTTTFLTTDAFENTDPDTVWSADVYYKFSTGDTQLRMIGTHASRKKGYIVIEYI